uniref:Uncharacterized protein n=1 Tax=Cannabis sativa TaxID=3483 RepID=A0A803PTC1_CANSA
MPKQFSFSDASVEEENTVKVQTRKSPRKSKGATVEEENSVKAATKKSPRKLNEKVCESYVADDEKLVNVIRKDKKKQVSKSHGKKKSETHVDAAPLFYRS